MSQYLFILLYLAVMLLLKERTTAGIGTNEYVLGRTQKRTSPLFAAVIFLPILIMATVRTNIGDTPSYVRMFKGLPSTFSALAELVPTVTKDRGFTALSGVIKCIFGESDTVYLFILALIQSAALVAVYRKYSESYLLSVFLFVASTDYLSWMFNGLRQFTAVTLIFAATTLMLRRRWILTVAVILLASTMHQSALIMLAVVLIAQGKAWNRRTVLFLTAALVAVLYVDSFTELLDDMMKETQYANVVSDWTLWEDDGTNVFRVLVYAMPTVLSLVGLRYIRAADDPVINFCTNMSIVSTGIYIISMFTSGIFIGRLPIYASLYNYILLPWEINHMFTQRSARVMRAVTVAAYVAFYWYQVHVTWGLM